MQEGEKCNYHTQVHTQILDYSMEKLIQMHILTFFKIVN